MTIASCPPPTAPIRGVVVFSPTDFKALYPEFVSVGDAALNRNFTLATLQLANGCGSRVCDAVQRELLLDLLTAHITQLFNGVNGQPPAGIVGRIDKATEGSVSVGAGMGTEAYGQPYYDQTQYGAMYWAATARYRTMMYVPPPAVCADFGVAAITGPNPWTGFYGGGNCGGC